MRTSKPISTISYNTEPYLRNVLEELHRNRVISDYMFIRHFKEQDEAKDHFHVWLNPNKMLDTMVLQDKFKELDPSNPLKPLGCINFKSSKVDDWILYCQHFEPYLVSKMENRQFHYVKEDFKFADELTFEDLYNHAFRGSEWAINNQRLQLLTSGVVEPLDMVMTGSVPLNMAGQMNALDRLLAQRNGRKTHTPVLHRVEVDEDGVILEPVNADDDGVLQAEQGTMFDGFIPDDTIQF